MIANMKKKIWPFILLLYVCCTAIPAQENPFMRMAGKKYADYSYDLAMYMHYTVFASRDTVHIKRMIDQLREVAEKTGSKAWTWEVRLAELGLLDIKNVMEGNENRSVEELQIAYDLLGKAEKDNMPQIALRLRFLIVESYWDVIRNYELAFEQCVILDKRLHDISTDDFPEKADYLAKIADIHYHFRDYPKAMFYFSRILEENDNISNQSAKQHARNGLGLCFRNINNLDSSDYYFSAILPVYYLNTDKERYREIWHGIANGNLGQNMLLRGEYDQAIPLLKSSFEWMTKHNDFAFASGAAVNLATIYLAKDAVADAKRYLDVAQEYNRLMPREGRIAQIYETLSRYYMATGDKKRSAAYLDSTLLANKEYENQFNAMVLLRMEQKETALQQQELAREKEKRRQTQLRLLYFAVGFAVISLLLVAVFILYRRKQAAYRALVIKTRQWAQTPYIPVNSEPAVNVQTNEANSKPNDSDLLLFEQLNRFVVERRIHLNPEATLDYVASQMDVNRKYLSYAVNRCTGDNFSAFINEFRVKEAVRLMTDKSKMRNLSIEGIALEAGFNDRKTFYRVFKKSTGFSPADYRENLRRIAHP